MHCSESGAEVMVKVKQGMINGTLKKPIFSRIKLPYEKRGKVRKRFDTLVYSASLQEHLLMKRKARKLRALWFKFESVR